MGALEAVHNAVVLEQVAKIAFYTEQINPNVQNVPKQLQDKPVAFIKKN